ASTPNQFFILRPIPGVPRHHTPIPGLYHIGASTHPGAGLHGASGVLVAQALLGARKMKRVCASPSAQGCEMGPSKVEPRMLTHSAQIERCPSLSERPAPVARSKPRGLCSSPACANNRVDAGGTASFGAAHGDRSLAAK